MAQNDAEGRPYDSQATVYTDRSIVAGRWALGPPGIAKQQLPAELVTASIEKVPDLFSCTNK